MKNFNFISPTKIYFGKNREIEIGKIVKEFGYKKVLLHYGQSSIKKIGLYDKIVNSLREENIDFIELSGVEPNPKIELVRKGTTIVKNEKVDFILAVGGGSVIDSAKAISAGALVDFDPWLFNSHEKVCTNSIPVGVILTISAAGSELSNSCVITNGNIKNGFNSDSIRPVFAIMNPELTYSVSKYQTACGIVDIMMHTLERFLVDYNHSDLVDDWALTLIKNVMKAGKIAIDNPNDYDARSTLMLASSFSHNGLTGLGNDFYFTVHKLEHQITGLYDHVAHGAGLSILFVPWAKVVYPYLKDRFLRLSYEVLDVVPTNNVEEDIEFGLNKLKQYFIDICMPVSLSEVNVDDTNFELIANRITKNDTVKVVGFVELDKEKILKVLNLAK